MQSAHRIGLLAVAVSACVDFPSAAWNPACSKEVDLGSFNGRAAGASTDSLAGCGYFIKDTLTRHWAFVVTNGGPLTHAPMVKLFRDSVPITGIVYHINQGPKPITGVMILGSQTFNIISGTFFTKGEDRYPSIYAKSAFLSGHLDITGADSTGAFLSVTGDFYAICVGPEETGSSNGQDPLKKRQRSCEPDYAGLKKTR